MSMAVPLSRWKSRGHARASCLHPASSIGMGDCPRKSVVGCRNSEACGFGLWTTRCCSFPVLILFVVIVFYCCGFYSLPLFDAAVPPHALRPRVVVRDMACGPPAPLVVRAWPLAAMCVTESLAGVCAPLAWTTPWIGAWLHPQGIGGVAWLPPGLWLSAHQMRKNCLWVGGRR